MLLIMLSQMFYECENMLCITVIIVLIRYCISEHRDGFIICFRFVRLLELDGCCSSYVQKRVTLNLGQNLESAVPNIGCVV